MKPSPYILSLPEAWRSSVIFASPHSGRNYPLSFLRNSILDEQTIRSSEDAFVDMLFSNAPDLGSPLLAATAPRAYVDLNRSADELDPGVIAGVGRTTHNPRVNSGLGVVPRVVANGRSIYRGKIAYDAAQKRLRDVWYPYHSKLQDLIDQGYRAFGETILIDCHSMPHEAIEVISQGSVRKPHIVLGDRFGAAAGQEIVDRIEAAFTSAGLKVARNTPFAGAYTAQHYGRPSRGQHVIQVEIDRALYMDERLIRPHSGFEDFKALLQGIVADIVSIGGRDEIPLAAE
ncbi:MAG: N-formylglutamate amidohydrolase [Rhodobacteraceae bacterium]|nr:N-formylglutamate amidohydrolase [Paracoccaceae bacterium]